MKYKLFKKKKPKSNFFSFKKIINTRNYNVSYYKGWHELLVLRINLLNSTITENFFHLFEAKKNEKLEKFIIISKGTLSIGKKNLFKKLRKFDCIHTKTSLKDLIIKNHGKTELFIVFGTKNIRMNNKLNFFNFEKNLKKTDLWGGKCISRVFNGKGMTLVLFRLKRGFKFHDNGHRNEQLTWLVDGKMKFYVKNKSKLLRSNGASVDIGPHDYHGGMSLGAIGFDAFSPKRSEKRYS
tara:strand:- start:3853 stop:4566 length:714 start_codon:yes stop_codon:yes gene_type:complete